MHLEELRTILLSERETGRLTGIPHDTYEATKKELEELTSEVYANEDPFSDRARLLIERASSIRETMQDLFRIRTEKILSLAAGHIDGHPTEKEEVKKMLPGEREMFEAVTAAITGVRDTLIVLSHENIVLPGKDEDYIEPEDERQIPEESDRVPVAGPGYVLARVLDNMEPFMGVDGRIYHLKKEDIVTLPRRNAEVLNERNIVLKMNSFVKNDLNK
jgi:DNA replication factor GINS